MTEYSTQQNLRLSQQMLKQQSEINRLKEENKRLRELSNFRDVGDFHEKFDLDNVTHHGAGLRPWDDELLEFRMDFLKEELAEFNIGVQERDHAQMFDALLDLVYVAMGTAQMLGYPWQAGWDAVQRANMAKIRAAKDGADSKRDSSFDVVKPPGWEPPDIVAILRRSGYVT